MSTRKPSWVWIASLLVGAGILVAGPSLADGPPNGVVGRWLTESKHGVVDIHPCGAKLCGSLVWIYKQKDDSGRPVVDLRNPEKALQTRSVCGLDMLGGFVAESATHWTDGWIYDPESGKTYKANITLQPDGTLKLRGYVGIPLFGESQIWTRADGSQGTCSAG
jgi:uncharacterized protein (DUF2147 family)